MMCCWNVGVRRILPLREHYRLMSVLKNLVMNAAEAIQSGLGSGMILVEERVVPGADGVTVRDTGPGISKRAMAEPVPGGLFHQI